MELDPHALLDVLGQVEDRRDGVGVAALPAEPLHRLAPAVAAAHISGEREGFGSG